MKILGLDSAAGACSVAVVTETATLARRFEVMARGQSEALIPMTEAVLEEAGLEAADLDHIAVSVGPGAFTGLRTAIAAALGLGLAGNVDLGGVSTLESVAHGFSRENSVQAPFAVVMDSRRDDIYAQAHAPDGAPLDELAPVASSEFAAWCRHHVPDGKPFLVGDAADRARSLLQKAGIEAGGEKDARYPDAQYVAGLALRKLSENAPLLPARPLYLRPPDAVIPKDGGRLRA